MKNKIYTSAPLPFQGQKRFFIQAFKAVLTEFKSTGIDTVVDLFGGSGLLSHASKRLFPELRVIYNDYDNYHIRLDSVDSTNYILSVIRSLVDSVPPSKKVPDDIKEKILKFIKDKEYEGYYIDYLTLSASILFSGRYVSNFEELKKATLYNKVSKNKYNATGYVDGLEVVKYDYFELLKQFSGKSGVLFVADPPYLSTSVSSYKTARYWRLTDYLNILSLLRENNYVYFTSDKGCLIELLDWISSVYPDMDICKGSKIVSREVIINKDAKYKDIMLYRCK